MSLCVVVVVGGVAASTLEGFDTSEDLTTARLKIPHEAFHNILDCVLYLRYYTIK